MTRAMTKRSGASHRDKRYEPDLGQSWGRLVPTGLAGSSQGREGGKARGSEGKARHE